ncbi:LOW QUALITY PROTEIN: vitellogenin receptor [Pogonomyrmex barbatus]|uniref:LOW QUALITY PROTEIN: vitellogenin receptor n=1 Tax=Pogonomyrmex barbatus TaxID=144034 RepID=A0A8N1SBC7_9HYME|nr:LOW QUALITY PROTEIN: vitellogenin receptor [Pogonomyrmex barbatus]
MSLPENNLFFCIIRLTLVLILLSFGGIFNLAFQPTSSILSISDLLDKPEFNMTSKFSFTVIMRRLVTLLFICSFLHSSFELGFPFGITCSSLDYFRCHNGECIPFSERCDEFEDCLDGSDEENCDNFDLLEHPFIITCAKDEFQCKTNECIPAAKFCDAINDCPDKSDEYEGCVEKLNCTGKFQCHDKHCISEEWVCDGSKDCPDGSDEWNCKANKTSSESDCKTKNSQYFCKNHRCISLDKVCDNKDDCGDGSDEGSNCTSLVHNCTYAGCSQQCKQTPKESVCFCKSGFKLEDDNRTCSDINECQFYGTCDQNCTNFPGSYKCTCQEEYFLQNDTRTCKARGGEATLIYATKNKIRGMYLDSKIHFEVTLFLSHIVGVAMDGDYTYYGKQKVIIKQSSRYDIKKSLQQVYTSVTEIVVDWITKNIYFIDDGYNHIVVCDNNATYCVILINDILEPKGLALLPSKGKMYWSDCSSNAPHISETGMDGKNTKILVSTNIVWPNSITIDYPNDRLYWVDAKLQMIETIRLDGTDRRIVLHDVIQHPSSLVTFENRLYWSDWESKTIQSCNKFNGKDWHILIRTNNEPYGLYIEHSALKRKFNNPCHPNPCSELCMLNQNKSYTCACTSNKELDTDNHTCREKKKEQYLLIATLGKLIYCYYGMIGKPKTINNPKLTLDFITKLAFDSSSGKVYICNNNWLSSANVTRYDPSNEIFETPFTIHAIIEAIAFDHIGNNLYLSNALEKSIEVHSMTTMQKTVLYFQESPYEIMLVPEESKMFVSFGSELHVGFKKNKLNLKRNFSLYEMNMNGLGLRKLIKENLENSLIDVHVSMCYDKDSKTLFIGDHSAGVILSYSNGNTHVFRTGLKFPANLAVAGDNIFWTEHNTQKIIYWTNFKISPPNHKGVAFEFSSYSFLSIISVHKEPIKEVNGCQKNNGNCSHVCLLSTATSFICACPPKMVLINNSTCSSLPKCNADEYMCSEHNICIKKEQRCDGKVDCPNGEDETTDCEKHCEENEFMCKDGTCINLESHCNTFLDCPDHSDEENCDKPKCQSDQFQCTNGSCIPRIKKCDGLADCLDLSDESFYNCIVSPSKQHVCELNEFMCNDQTCIPKTFVCDGEMDCIDASDEASELCKSNEKKCKNEDFQCANGHCISLSLKCNGINDCFDGSDEKYCLDGRSNRFTNCSENEYRCFDTELCLPKTVRCNGKNDCPKNDDEHDCLFCSEDEFACDDRRCIPFLWVCDGDDDCGDRLDEKNCDGDKKIVNRNELDKCNEFMCNSYEDTCLPYSKVCDDIRDCRDGSDEGGKCQNACAQDNFCQGICYKTPKGAVCDCQDGYRLAADTISCDDINECENDVCSQICVNIPGSYRCLCHEGYVIRKDKVSCKAVGPPMELITATDIDIRKISSDLESTEVIHSLSGLSVSSLDVNAIDDSVYWSNSEFGTIKKMDIKTGKINATLFVGQPHAIVVDWVTNHVYVGDSNLSSTIKVCDLEKQRCATLVRLENQAKALSLAVDPVNNWLFWAQITWQKDEPFSKIYRTDLTGADVKIIAFQNISFVSGMAIDFVKSKLYWSDSFRKTIESSNFDGSQRSTFLRTTIYHPLDISIYEQSLYWLMSSDGQLQNCKLYGDKSCKILNVGKNNIQKSFAILHISRQSKVKNPCDEQNCDYMCIPKKHNAICICANGELINPNTTCLSGEITVPAKSYFKNTRYLSNVYSVTLVVLFIAVLMMCGYYYYQKNKLKFKSSDVGFSSIRFQNPSYDRRDEVEVTLQSIASDSLSPGAHEYINPMDDKLYKTAMKSIAGNSSEERNVEEVEKQDPLIHFVPLK